VFQSIMPNCYIAFEWPHEAFAKIYQEYGPNVEPMNLFTFMPLGEL
jgi:hypothetical protein